MSNGGSGQGDSGKKDLTGLHELPPADPVVPEGGADFSINEAPSIEQVDHFESLDQIGMMDHPTPPPEETVSLDASVPDPAVSVESAPLESPPLDFGVQESSGMDFASTPTAIETPANDAFEAQQSPMDDFSFQAPPAPEPAEPPAPVPILEELRKYGESTKSAPFEPGIRLEFHLQVSGDFDPYARDKLLLFITDHPIGMTSSELDFQIQAGRVLLPRISEFSGIKLIQELRDSGLEFSLTPASSEAVMETEPTRAHFGEPERIQLPLEIPVLPENSFRPEDYVVMDSVQLVHYLRAEILEVEKSDLFQELLERMTSSLKKRAQLKGAHALTRLEHRITPLRLPSQYQLELSASLLKKIES